MGSSVSRSCGAALETCGADSNALAPGNADTPGFAPLPRFSRLLAVGNQFAASHGDFEVVVSTVCPLDEDGEKAAHLTTHQIFFDDNLGSEDASDTAVARRRILEGAAIVAVAIKSGKRTLVHCEWGQNRSGSIVCAYAILYCGWAAEDAIDYMQRQNRKARSYWGQRPMANPVFNEIMFDYEQKRDEFVPSAHEVARSADAAESPSVETKLTPGAPCAHSAHKGGPPGATPASPMHPSACQSASTVSGPNLVAPPQARSAFQYMVPMSPRYVLVTPSASAHQLLVQQQHVVPTMVPLVAK